MAPSTFVLQRLLAPRAESSAALYLRCRDGAAAEQPGAELPLPDSWHLRGTAAADPEAALPDGGLPLAVGTVLSTDSFFGAFYRAWWRAWTPVQAVSVVLRLRGAARVRLHEDTGQQVRLLAEAASAGVQARGRSGATDDSNAADTTAGHEAASAAGPAGAVQTVVLAAGRTPVGPSRLFVEVEALEPCWLEALEFVTDTPPQHRATLSVGLVTMGQEAAFARTLARLCRLADAEPALGAIHVVNHGAPFTDPALRGQIGHPAVRAVAQANLGGAGGFARGLAAALDDPEPARHHLVMDDDATLDERLVPRALRFLDHAGDRLVLGAGMLDARRPTVMHEAGATHRRDNVIMPWCHDIDLARADRQGYFNAVVHADFTAWWFTILPLRACRRVGLPAPLFLRGDDFEYAERLAAAGVPSIALPGIGVWHAPFYDKPPGWQAYYDLRNRLIFAALYPARVRQLSVAHVGGLISTAVLTHSYGLAAVRLRAVRDFLAGPEAVLGRDAGALQAEVAALARAGAPEVLVGADWADRPLARVAKRPEGLARLALSQLFALLRTGLGPHDRSTAPVLRDFDSHAQAVAGRAWVMTNWCRSYHLRHVPQRGRMWWLMLAATGAVLHYRLRRRTVGADWRAQMPAHCTREAWATLFAAADRAEVMAAHDAHEASTPPLPPVRPAAAATAAGSGGPR